MTSASPAARLATGGSIVQTSTPTSQLDHHTSSFQIKMAPLLGSSDSISEHKVVRETLEGTSDYVPLSEECFEFESSPSCIQTVKGRLRAHFNFRS